ncbi:MAG: hypothetical protein ACOYOD_10235 [Saprospiraceae bacterium]
MIDSTKLVEQHLKENLAQKTGLAQEDVQKILGEMVKEGRARKSTHRGKEIFGRV